MTHETKTHELLTALMTDDRDELLRSFLRILVGRGIGKKWSKSLTPHLDLDQECMKVASHPGFIEKIKPYLCTNPVLVQSVQMFLAHLSVAANLRAENVPEPQQFLIPLGTRIARWIPTFLVIDGPLGQFLRSKDSPLNELLRTEHESYPILAQARDVFNHDLFRQVRNGIAHWAFRWIPNSDGGRLICFDLKGSNPSEVELSLLEAEALHIISYNVIEVLDRRILSQHRGLQ